MLRRPTPWRRTCAAALVVAAAATAAAPAAGRAALAGVVLGTDGATPLEGARVRVAAIGRDLEAASAPTAGDGRFALSNLPSGPYALAVETAGRLHAVPTPLTLAPDERREVAIALAPTATGPTPTPTPGGFWSKPWRSGATVAGAAIVIGYILQQTVDTGGTPASPAGP